MASPTSTPPPTPPGRWSPSRASSPFALFSIGIIGTGLLAIPVLAGSAAYAVGDAWGWKTGLDHMPWQATGFYAVIGAAVILGLGIDYVGIDPIKALYWSAVLNGLVAVPMMAGPDGGGGQQKEDGRIPRRPRAGGLGWLSPP